MKLAICSDIHLEFGGYLPKNTENADVLVLSGDICVAHYLSPETSPYTSSYSGGGMRYLTHLDRIYEFFTSACKEFKYVIYVMGNHEHYHGDFAKSYEILKDGLEQFKNLHILDRESVELDGVTFIGGTLWTDMNGDDDFTKRHVRSMMNDYQCVKNSNNKVSKLVPKLLYDEDGIAILVDNKLQYGPKELVEYIDTLKPEDTVNEFHKMVQYISRVIEGRFDDKFVVVGHHSPSRLSTHPRYAHDTTMNGAYSSHLDFFIEDHPQIKLWTHGHTHHSFDYQIGLTRVVCNPRGYIGHESQASKFQLKYVEI